VGQQCRLQSLGGGEEKVFKRRKEVVAREGSFGEEDMRSSGNRLGGRSRSRRGIMVKILKRHQRGRTF